VGTYSFTFSGSTVTGSISGQTGAATYTISGSTLTIYPPTSQPDVLIATLSEDKKSFTINSVQTDGEEDEGGSFLKGTYYKGGGDDSGRVWSAGTGNNYTTIPIATTTVELPLSWRYSSGGNEMLWVWIYITTSTSIGKNDLGNPATTTASKQLTVTFTNKNGSVDWNSDSGNDG